MAHHFDCKCPERKKPVEERNWVVVQRNCHHSAFAGGRRTPSDYSTVRCRSCLKVGRTKAKFVNLLKDQ